VAAHRGFSSYYPENTLPAYSSALDQAAPSAPADWLETDFQQTADRQWIALHDGDFARTTDVEQVFPRATNPTKYDASGRPLVDRFTLAEIKRLDAGRWKGKLWAGLRVPTLEETLDLVSASASSSTRLLVEPKLGTQQEALDLYDAVRAYDDAHADTRGYRPFVPADQGIRIDRAVFDTFNVKVAERLARDRPAADVAFVADDASETGPSAFPGGVATLLADSLVTKARVAALHRADQQVLVWTVDEQDRWLELAALGVDAVVTDNAKRARVVLTGND
jgi:glycerophosphoryl diester phosphodiesterase